MANKWTDEQKSAFSLSDRNILVAAAAGSGKTAVLVERIIRKITDEKNPVNVDELVVVTFTNAAAAEMRQRIRTAIDDLVDKQPDNMHLVKQLTLINNAQISTIDSFCLGIIRSHFTEADLDPAFRTADTGEIKLIENDVMEDMLEEYYSSDNEKFFQFVDAYGTGRDDKAIEEMILKLYRFARSNPWPDEWYDMCLKPYTTDGINDNKAIEFLYDNIRNVLKDYEVLYEKLEKICSEPQGPLMYIEAIEEDLAGIRNMLSAESFTELARRVNLLSFKSLGRKKVDDVDEQKKSYVMDMRNAYKKYVTETLMKKIFVCKYDQIETDVKECSDAVCMLIELAKNFAKRMASEKKNRNIIDFNDMEHMALNILVKNENGVKTYTDIAKVYAKKYNEIMIDEYQDSNLLQEEILTAVSKSVYGGLKNNIYMVGDVKQSIYKFRLACPDLFIGKYNRYKSVKKEDGDNIKIELQMNFRSRKNVLECSNDVFRRVMNKKFCGIDYNDDARLNTGFPYPTNDEGFGLPEREATQLVVINTPDTSSKDARNVEGEQIALMIKEMMADGKVYDAKLSEYRKMRYSDIVILTRSVKDWAEVFVEELMNEGIPAYCESNAGYFATYEIKTVMNFLSVIDNPTKDVEMAGVMMSYYGGFTAEELAKIRMSSEIKSLFNQMNALAEKQDESNAETKTFIEKIKCFVNKINNFRKKAEYMSIQELVWEIVYATGYYDYVGTMPAGKQRQANVDILLQRASSFENTSYSGLFNFLRYVERMKKSEVDYGEASVLGENEDIVRVMSIHKSKGLEFPVVFVAGMHKKMNMKDTSGNIVIDGDLGIGLDVVRLDKRTKRKTVIKAAVSRKLTQDTISEEQRVLYVAMTRAREKLIMTGVDKEAVETVEKWQSKANEIQMLDSFSYLDNENFKNYFDMVMPVALLKKDNNIGKFEVEIIEKDDDKEKEEVRIEEVENKDEKGAGSYPAYAYEDETNRKAKITVSELKQMQHDADIDENKALEANLLKSQNEEKSEKIPSFIAGKQEKLAGNERGTAYHRVMECLDYNRVSSQEELRDYIKELVKEEKMTKIQAECIDVKDIFKFCQSEIGKRVAKAFERGNIKREQPFVFMPKLKEEIKDQLVQGVIDLYIEENDEFVIVDYKTDRVKHSKEGEELLVKRYAVQLEYYALALEQLTGKKVKQKYIYSFEIGKEILV